MPFFWSQHYDVAVSDIGHVERWDRTEIDGLVEARNSASTRHRVGFVNAQAKIEMDILIMGRCHLGSGVALRILQLCL